MERFNIRCPDHYPMKCNLSPADKDYLLTNERYKAFFIFQYKDQDEWLSNLIEKYFNERTWRLFNAGKEGGTGTKFCNICRYALASDFGIASLTPFNYNVFQEIGLMQGLQKQLLYVLNPQRMDKEKKLPFDIDDQIYVEHTDEKSLEAGLDKKIPLILEKIQLLSGYESAQREHLRIKLNQMSDDAKEMLRKLHLEGTIKFSMSSTEFITWANMFKLKPEARFELMSNGFIVKEAETQGVSVMEYYKLDEKYRKYLEELLWE